MTIIEKVALAVIKDDKVLMARSRKNQKVFYTLGGKIEANETDKECLIREIKEEVNTDIDEDSIMFLGTFQAAAHDKTNTMVRVRLYKGELIGIPTPSSEVEEIAFFDSSIEEEHQSDLGRMIIEFLRKKSYIK